MSLQSWRPVGHQFLPVSSPAIYISPRYQESTQDGCKPPASVADSTPAPIDPEVMQIKEDLDTGPDPLLDWRIPYLDCLVRGVLPTDKIEAQHLACCQVIYLDRSGTLQAEPH
jgi:hypothetical protein